MRTLDLTEGDAFRLCDGARITVLRVSEGKACLRIELASDTVVINPDGVRIDFGHGGDMKPGGY